MGSVFVFAVEEMAQEIEQYQGLRALRLEGNTVGVDAAQAIAKALESKDQLQVLVQVCHSGKKNKKTDTTVGK